MLPGTSVLMAQTPQPSAPVGGRSPALCSDAPICQVMPVRSMAHPSYMSRSAEVRRPKPLHGIDLSGYVTFKAAHDLLLGLALGATTRNIAAGALVDPHAHDADQVQSAVGVAVSYIRLRRCLTTLPEDASTGETPQRLANEASLPSLSGLSPTVSKSVAAWSVPIAGREISSGAVSDTKRSSRVSSTAISFERNWERRATERRAN